MHATGTSLLSQVPFIVDAVWAAGLALNVTAGTGKALRFVLDMYHVGNMLGNAGNMILIN